MAKMTRWRLEYVVDAVGDTPLTRTIDAEIDTEGLDPFGEDEQVVIDRLRAILTERVGDVHFNRAYPVPDETGDAPDA